MGADGADIESVADPDDGAPDDEEMDDEHAPDDDAAPDGAAADDGSDDSESVEPVGPSSHGSAAPRAGAQLDQFTTFIKEVVAEGCQRRQEALNLVSNYQQHVPGDSHISLVRQRSGDHDMCFVTWSNYSSRLARPFFKQTKTTSTQQGTHTHTLIKASALICRLQDHFYCTLHGA